MSDTVDRATFMDQVKVGDMIYHDRYEGPNLERVWEAWTVTGVRHCQTALTNQAHVVLVGISERGEPRHTEAAPWVPIIIRERIPDAQPDGTP